MNVLKYRITPRRIHKVLWLKMTAMIVQKHLVWSPVDHSVLRWPGHIKRKLSSRAEIPKAAGVKRSLSAVARGHWIVSEMSARRLYEPCSDSVAGFGATLGGRVRPS